MSYSDFSSDYENTFSRNLFLFRCIGIDFFDESLSYFRKNNIRLIIFCLIFCPFVMDHFSLISNIRADNFLESVRVVPVCLILFLNIVKILIAIIRKSQIRAIFLEVGELWPKGLDPGEPKSVILKAWLRRIKIPLDSAFASIFGLNGVVLILCIGPKTYLPENWVYLYLSLCLSLWRYNESSIVSPLLLISERLFLTFSVYFYYALANLILFEALPFLITGFNLCNGVRIYLFPFQPTDLWVVDSIFTYLITYLWEIGATIPCQLCLFIPFDLTMVTMTANLSALLRLLQEDLKNAIKIQDGERRSNKNMFVSDPEGYAEVRRIAQVHQELLIIADQLSKMFGLVIFIHVAFAALEICFFGFLTVVYGGFAETIANFLSVLNAMFTIFLLSLSGQFLSDTSTQVADAAYESYWYQSDIRVRKVILFLIIRAQRPSYLSALGFSELTLRSFSKIMSSSWTYFSLLIQVYQDN